MTDTSIGSMLSSAVTARVRATLDGVASGTKVIGASDEQKSFAAKLRDQLDAQFPTDANAATESADDIYSRAQALDLANGTGQGDALMREMDAQDAAARNRTQAKGLFDF
jgi:hypothetical protein